MQIKNHYAKQSKNIVCLLLMSALVFLGGCAQVANQKSSSSKYGQANASKWKAFETSPTPTPSEASQKINITVMGQSFRYLDGFMSNPAQQPTVDQLYRTLNANKHTQNTSTQFSGATPNKVFKFISNVKEFSFFIVLVNVLMWLLTSRAIFMLPSP